MKPTTLRCTSGWSSTRCASTGRRVMAGGVNTGFRKLKTSGRRMPTATTCDPATTPRRKPCFGGVFVFNTAKNSSLCQERTWSQNYLALLEVVSRPRIQVLPQVTQVTCFYRDTVNTKDRLSKSVFCVDVPGKGLEPS